MKKITKKQWFMDMAFTCAKRATCNKRKVGAIIVKDDIIISTGYNGNAKGEPECIDIGCTLNEKGKCISTIHAEVNAIINCAKTGVSLVGTTIYTTDRPCNNCSRAIINAGIKKVYYVNEYDTTFKLEDYIDVELLER